MRCLLLVLFGCWGSVAKLQAQAISLADTTMVRCVATSLKTTYKYREPIALDVQLISQANQPILLIDGAIYSEIWTYFATPKLEVYRLGKNGPEERMVRANKSGDLSFGVNFKNLVLLQPKQVYTLMYTQEAFSWAWPSPLNNYEPLRPGRYVARFVYSTTVSSNRNLNKMIYQLAGAREKTQEALKNFIDQIPVVRAVSAPIYLTITR